MSSLVLPPSLRAHCTTLTGVLFYSWFVLLIFYWPQLPPLFDGCFFFLLGSFRAPPKQELLRLLRDAGGQLLSRQPKPDSDVTQTVSAAAYHAAPGSDQALCTQYILYDPRASPHRAAAVIRRRGKVWTTPASWVVDCIAAFRLLPVPES